MTQRLDHNALAPDGMKALGALYGYVRRSGLPDRLVDLVYLRASQINGCAYCIDMHTRDLVKAGVGAETLALVSVWREAGAVFDARERAALAWTESVTAVSQTGAPDADYAAAAAVFTPKELVDLTLAIGLMNTYNRLAIGFRTTPQAAVVAEAARAAA